MKAFYLFISSVLVFLSGCSSLRAVKTDELDWQPLNIPNKECPDLTGTYKNNRQDGFSPFFAGKNIDSYSAEKARLRAEGKPLPPEFGWDGIQTESSANEGVLFNSMETRTTFFSGLIFSIDIKRDFLIQRTNRLGQKYITPLNTAMAGCGQESLILRNLTRTTGGDFAPISVLYGELEMRKLPNGDLQVTQRRRQRTLSWGSRLLGPAKEDPAVVRVYPLIR